MVTDDELNAAGIEKEEADEAPIWRWVLFGLICFVSAILIIHSK